MGVRFAPSRRTMLGAILAFVSMPFAAPAEPAKRYRCYARLEREPDHKETRTVETVCEDGKTVRAIDGDRDITTHPPSVIGLACDFTVKADGDATAVKVHAVYRTTHVGNTDQSLLKITATTDVTARLYPTDASVSTLDVNGTPFTLTIRVKPVE